jgi:hypothetical protein
MVGIKASERWKCTEIVPVALLSQVRPNFCKTARHRGSSRGSIGPTQGTFWSGMYGTSTPPWGMYGVDQKRKFLPGWDQTTRGLEGDQTLEVGRSSRL